MDPVGGTPWRLFTLQWAVALFDVAITNPLNWKVVGYILYTPKIRSIGLSHQEEALVIEKITQPRKNSLVSKGSKLSLTPSKVCLLSFTHWWLNYLLDWISERRNIYIYIYIFSFHDFILIMCSSLSQNFRIFFSGRLFWLTQQIYNW